MQIRSVEARQLVVPVEIPLLKKSIKRGLIFVEIKTDQGISGYGETDYSLHQPANDFINRFFGGIHRSGRFSCEGG
ncbi:MAG: hypothetical protein QF619_01520 [Candidatus Binatia bacterium]|jgi:L-alanine-DL-glutamate epimerase-like enolase superfamily enzyme|nr:hypothetical protein [Candidatus Binatia bacterium]